MSISVVGITRPHCLAQQDLASQNTERRYHVDREINRMKMLSVVHLCNVKRDHL